jgi:hypothetical protein
MVHWLRFLRLRAGRLLGILCGHRGRAMAGNGGKEDAYQKKRAEQDSGFAGEMDERAAG